MRKKKKDTLPKSRKKMKLIVETAVKGFARMLAEKSPFMDILEGSSFKPSPEAERLIKSKFKPHKYCQRIIMRKSRIIRSLKECLNDAYGYVKDAGDQKLLKRIDKVI